MRAKEYLSKARHLDVNINNKIRQLEKLKTLATSCTSVITGMPHNPSASHSRTEDIIVKIIELEAEIKSKIEKLVDTKQDITHTIDMVEDNELKLLLELRYLNYESWEDIAVMLKYSVQHIFRLHALALKKVDEILKMRVNESK